MNTTKNQTIKKRKKEGMQYIYLHKEYECKKKSNNENERNRISVEI